VSYNSSCRACDHKHDGYVCNWQVHKQGTINLKPINSQIWGIQGGMSKSWDNSTGSEQLSFRQFDMYRSDPFEYEMEVDCGCRYYVPSDNLEFLEWKYERSDKTI
jgi:hypothetical protein